MHAKGTGTFLPQERAELASNVAVPCVGAHEVPLPICTREERSRREEEACGGLQTPGPEQVGPTHAGPSWEHSSCISLGTHDLSTACWQPSVGDQGVRTVACWGSVTGLLSGGDTDPLHAFIQGRGQVPGCPRLLDCGQEGFSLPCRVVTPTAPSCLLSSFIHPLINPALLSASFALLFLWAPTPVY